MSCCSETEQKPTGQETVFVLDAICNPGTLERIEYNSNVVFTGLGGDLFRIQIKQTPPNQDGALEAVGSVLWNTNGFLIATVANASRFRLEVSEATGALSIFSEQAFDGLRATWTFTVMETITSASVCVRRTFSGAIPLPGSNEPTPVGCPSLMGTVTATQDEKQICAMHFTVVIPQGPCADCPTQATNTCVTEQTLQYRYYSPNVTRVVKGKGCTLAQKVAFLQARGKVVTLENLATYSTLRLALSKLVFGNFDVDYLRQSYYPQLIKRLSKSPFCRFLARLQIPAYANYETLFLC